MTGLWCYIEGKRDVFEISIPIRPSNHIGNLKKKIYNQGPPSYFGGCAPMDLILIKVDVDLREVTRKAKVEGGYKLDANEQQTELSSHENISQVWPEPPAPGHLHVHVVVSQPGLGGLGGPTAHDTGLSASWNLYDAAKKLHKAMWRQDLRSKLQNVPQCKFKYLPATVANELQLPQLGCDRWGILVREEYLFTLKALEERQNEMEGIVITGHPGIGKSVFIFYALLHLLSKGQPVALQRDTVYFIFRQDGVEMHKADSDGLSFRPDEKPWAFTDSTERSRQPCIAFQNASRMGCAWFVLASSPAKPRYDRLRKDCNAGIFIMDCFTREESRALSIIRGLDVQGFLKNYETWGPSARTCLRLASGSITEDELEYDVGQVAKKFAENPSAITMEADSVAVSPSHWLFTAFPNSSKRDRFTLRVPTQHLEKFLRKAVAQIDANEQASFYVKTSSHPFFRGAFGYVFEKLFYVWLSSNPENGVSCTRWTMPAESTGSTAHEQEERFYLQPVGLRPEKVVVYGGEAGERGYGTANKHQTPFAWIPASRSDASFDAVVCTDKTIFTIQVTVAAKHSIKKKGFESLVKYLPERFRNERSWCHIFITDHKDTAAKLGTKKYKIADEMKIPISICTAVLDISLFRYSPEGLKFVQPHHENESLGMDDIEMEMDTE